MVVVLSCEVFESTNVTVAPATTAPVGSVTVPVTAEVDDVVCAKHTTGKRSKSRLTISDDFSFVIISESPSLFSFWARRLNHVHSVTSEVRLEASVRRQSYPWSEDERLTMIYFFELSR